jgi:hypothetical protein
MNPHYLLRITLKSNRNCPSGFIAKILFAFVISAGTACLPKPVRHPPGNWTETDNFLEFGA